MEDIKDEIFNLYEKQETYTLLPLNFCILSNENRLNDYCFEELEFALELMVKKLYPNTIISWKTKAHTETGYDYNIYREKIFYWNFGNGLRV